MAEEKNRESEKAAGGGGGDGDENGEMGFPVHSQVMKIRRELERVKHPSVEQPLETRRLAHGINRQRSCSPLGLANKRPISVGN